MIKHLCKVHYVQLGDVGYNLHATMYVSVCHGRTCDTFPHDLYVDLVYLSNRIGRPKGRLVIEIVVMDNSRAFTKLHVHLKKVHVNVKKVQLLKPNSAITFVQQASQVPSMNVLPAFCTKLMSAAASVKPKQATQTNLCVFWAQSAAAANGGQSRLVGMNAAL